MSIATRLRASAGFCRSQSTFGTTPNIAPPSRRSSPSLKIRTSKRPMRTSRQYGRRWRFATFVGATATSFARSGARAESGTGLAMTTRRCKRCRLGTPGSAFLAWRATASGSRSRPRPPGWLYHVATHRMCGAAASQHAWLRLARIACARWFAASSISSWEARRGDGVRSSIGYSPRKPWSSRGARHSGGIGRSKSVGRTAARTSKVRRTRAARSRSDVALATSMVAARRRRRHGRVTRSASRAKLRRAVAWMRPARCSRRAVACSRGLA